MARPISMLFNKPDRHRIKYYGVISSLSLASLNCSTNSFAASPPVDEFILRPFEVSATSKPIIYEGEEGENLARQVMPAASGEVLRVVTNPMIMLPMAAYYRGLWVEVVMKPQARKNDLCEEPHYMISFINKQPYVATGNVALSFHGGRIEGHRFDSILPRSRYYQLPQPSASMNAADDACRALASETPGWKQAESENAFFDQENAMAWLLKTLQNSGPTSLSCIGADGMPCNNDRNRLLAVLQEKPPLYSQKLFVPGEGWIRVFRYYQPPETVGKDRISNGYTVTMREPLGPKTPTIRFEFTRDTIPLV